MLKRKINSKREIVVSYYWLSTNKKTDYLLGNGMLHAERFNIYRALAAQLYLIHVKL
jgi:hypothetical protein